MERITAPGQHGVELAPLTRRHDFELASSLYRRVFGYGDRFSLNTRLMQSMTYAGGVNVGAWSQRGELVGFVYGFPGVDDREPYLFSQAACVSDSWRGRGVGSALKHAQMDQARMRGLQTMRWAFDPSNLRNACINLNKLGARGRWFRSDFYDDEDSDRLIVEWSGDSRECPAPLPRPSDSPNLFGLVQMIDEHLVAVTAPAGPTMPTSIKRALANSLHEALAGGFVATRCDVVAPTVFAYVCEMVAA